MKKRSLKELYSEAIGDTMGSDTLRGTGNFGMGNTRQLAGGLDPATKKIEDQEQAEINQNIDDLAWSISGKFREPPKPLGPNEPAQANINRGVGSSPQGGTTMSTVDVSLNPYGGDDVYDEDESLEEQFMTAPPAGSQRTPGDSRYRDLPGFPPMDTLVDPQHHVPSDNRAEMEAYYDDQEEDYQAWLKQKQLDEDLVQLTPTEPYKMGRRGGDEMVTSDEWLIDPQDHLNPPTNDDTPSGLGGMGVLVAPKDFVPADWQSAKNGTDDYTEENFMGLNEIIKQTIQEVFAELGLRNSVKTVEEAYTGIDDPTGDGEPKGGSAAFNKNKKEVLADLHKDDPDTVKGLDLTDKE